MNVVLLPMWFLSGAFFPVAGAPAWLEWIVRLNPLSYGTMAFRRVLYLGSDPMGEGLPSLGVCLTVLVIWCLACLGMDLWVVRRGIKV